MKLFTLVCLVFGQLTFSYSQELDTIKKTREDSLRDVQLINSEQFIAASDSIQFSDSVAQLALRARIAALKNADNSEKRKLQAQLDSMSRAKEERNLKMKAQVDSLRANTKGVPMIFHGDSLYFVYSKLGPFSASDRAKSVSEKLGRLVESGMFDPKKIKIFDGDESSDVLHGDLILLSVTTKDAFWLDMSTNAAAKSISEKIIKGVEAYEERTSFYRTAMRFVWLGVVLLILFLGIRYMRKGAEYVNKKIVAKIRPKMTSVKFKDYEFLSIERVEAVIVWVMKVVKWILILLVVYLALPTIFSIFPETEGIARQLFGYVLDPLKEFGWALINYIPELITIAVIIFITRAVVRLLKFLAMEIASEKLQIPGFFPDWARPTLNLIKVVVYAFSFIMIFPYLPGSDSPIFQGVSVFLGLLISMGSSSAISNIVSGLVITYMRPFKKGDRVTIGSTTGDVIEKTMLVTRLRTIKNEDITIPNSSILSGNTVNYTTSSQKLGLILHATITIGYDVPWRQVHELLIEAATNTELVLTDPSPFVFQTSLDDFYVSYQINAYTKDPDKSSLIYSGLYANIQDNFNRAGVEILSPHYRAARDGNTMAVPPEYLAPDYVPPSFRVKKD